VLVRLAHPARQFSLELSWITRRAATIRITRRLLPFRAVTAIALG
jgi:hypothetical protein